MGPIPPAPLFASLIVGYACAYEERGSIACLMDENKGCFYGFEPAHHAIKNPSHHPSQNRSAFPLPRRKGVRG